MKPTRRSRAAARYVAARQGARAGHPYGALPRASSPRGFVFFGRPVDEQVKQAVEKDLVEGVRALKALAKFSPYIAGAS